VKALGIVATSDRELRELRLYITTKSNAQTLWILRVTYAACSIDCALGCGISRSIQAQCIELYTQN
jgi:hypothetical protein